MDAESIKLLSAAIAIAVGCTGPAIAQGMMVSRAMESFGRNPEIQDKVFPKMVIAMAITESLAIYSLVIALLILFI